MKRPALSTRYICLLQALAAATLAVSYAAISPAAQEQLRQRVTGESSRPAAVVPRTTPLRVEPLYDDAQVVSDQELAAVLEKIRPVFPSSETKPNHVEHALRTWGVDADFDDDPRIMSGKAMRDFLLDHGRYLASWGRSTPGLLEDRPQGVTIRWGRARGASVHHDHCLASLTEAGVFLNEPVFTPARRDLTVNDLLQSALRDFRLDEREVEWSAMAFGLWLAPARGWTTADGREITFDRLARRLLRGDRRYGVCAGTHRVYSLLLLMRLDDMFPDEQMLSRDVRAEVTADLQTVRDLLRDSQRADGHWPSNWYEGAHAANGDADDPDHRKVIATGHHLEWLALAPRSLQPPREQILRAARWLIDHTLAQSPATIQKQYTFYSHVGTALALWRGTRPADFERATLGRSRPVP